MRIILLLSALTIALTACEGGTPPSARSSNGTHALGSPSGELLPGESGGCRGEVCGLGKDSVDD
jgi:hypothetical protein